ncbi:MAG: tetratricopeptide repeat protein [Proteobacteria bacterium]|nr:tetratricopeptide repeat protein [Pseudomonadota bacterium]MBU1741094.1 tetratricopeptide repeat protein [Pseudomonadota bacterium]
MDLKKGLKSLLNLGREPQYTRGIELYNQRQYAAAADQFDQFLEDRNRPGLDGQLARFYSGRAHRNVGLMALHRGQTDRAVASLERACLISPEQPDLRLYYGIALFNAGEYGRAAEIIEGLLHRGRGSLRVRIILARAQLAGERFDEARTLLDDLVRTHPGYPDLRYLLGLAEAGRGDLTAAVGSLNEALDIRPGYLAARLDLARVSLLADDYHTAREAAAALVDTVPDLVAGWWCLALAELGRGELAAARRAVDLLRDLDENHAAAAALEAVFNGHRPAVTGDPAGDALAELWREAGPPRGEGDWRQTARACRRAVRDEIFKARPWQPNFAEVVDVLESEADDGLCRLLQGILEERLADYPRFADLHFHLGRVYERLGRLDEALKSYQEAVSTNPGYAQAAQALENLVGKIGHSSEGD